MLDGKILAAVLATLTALAATTSGGNLDSAELNTNPNNIDTNPAALFNNPIGQIRKMITEAPEPETNVKASLQVEGLEEESFKLTQGRLTPANTTEVEMGSKKVSSDEQIQFYGFSGTVKTGNTTQISGTVQGVETSGVNISGQSSISRETDSDKVVINSAKANSIKLTGVSGEIESPSASTTIKGSNSQVLQIKGFAGDIVVYTDNSTVILNGKVGRLEAGSFSFGN